MWHSPEGIILRSPEDSKIENHTQISQRPQSRDFKQISVTLYAFDSSHRGPGIFLENEINTMWGKIP